MAGMLVLAGSPAYDPHAWQSFAGALVGASAALAGLLVVAASINISRVMQLPAVVRRLGGTLTMFTVVLLISSVLLVPGQSRTAVGTEIAILGAVAAYVVFRLRGLTGRATPYRVRTIRAAIMGTASATLITLAGVFCAIGVAGGLYWLAPGIGLAYLFGIGNSWVALVEILR
jgi:modulator of FtsH protease